jgi:hypothetical protein
LTLLPLALLWHLDATGEHLEFLFAFGAVAIARFAINGNKGDACVCLLLLLLQPSSVGCQMAEAEGVKDIVDQLGVEDIVRASCMTCAVRAGVSMQAL